MTARMKTAYIRVYATVGTCTWHVCTDILDLGQNADIFLV